MRTLRRLMMASAVLLASAATQAQDTPLMGWSSWNTFALNINEDVIKGQADAMVSTGLAKAGFSYINIDDGYFGGRDQEGNLLVHPERFPNGLKGLVDYIHSIGLKAGIYTDAGKNTCGSLYGSDKAGVGVGIYLHDDSDCNLWFRDLGFDFIKIDFCGGFAPNNVDHLQLSERERYTDISQAILRTGRKDVRMNVCRWAYPGTWVSEVAGSWRTTGDIYLGWNSVRDILFENLYLSAYASKGHYNDMDMLEVGRGLSEEEDATHFGMWCIMNSPLLVGCDMTKIPQPALDLMCNRELIDLNQDCLGQQAYPVAFTSECYVLVKDLKRAYGKERAVAVYNPTDKEQTVTFNLSQIELGGKASLRDLYRHEDATSLLNAQTGDIKVKVPAHGTRIYKVKAAQRLERTVYEAETAYIPAYQEITNHQSSETGVYLYDGRCSSGIKAAWLGRSERNSLQFRNVYSQKGGKYRLTIAFQSGEDRYVVVSTNGKRVDRVKTNSGSFDKIGTVTLDVELNKGNNNIVLSNTVQWMPDIDYIRLEKAE